jgi:hypothetical protein
METWGASLSGLHGSFCFVFLLFCLLLDAAASQASWIYNLITEPIFVIFISFVSRDQTSISKKGKKKEYQGYSKSPRVGASAHLASCTGGNFSPYVSVRENYSSVSLRFPLVWAEGGRTNLHGPPLAGSGTSAWVGGALAECIFQLAAGAVGEEAWGSFFFSFFLTLSFSENIYLLYNIIFAQFSKVYK